MTAARDSDAALRAFDLSAFEQAQLAQLPARPSNTTDDAATVMMAPDTSMWSARRVAAYRDAQSEEHSAAPRAVLRIPAIKLRVPVYEGTSERMLVRGAGRIEGTGEVAGAGNTGIAAHRDSFFRVLKDVRVGDTVFLDLLERTIEHRVVSIDIVEPTDVAVLADGPAPSLTLVTCYPFYFVGPAPKRYIVRAVRVNAPRARGTLVHEEGPGAPATSTAPPAQR